MTAVELLREALRSLLSHRLRAALASSGAAAGVAAIVAALAIGEGARRQAMADIGTLGMDNVVVRALAARDAKGRSVSPVLTLDDVDALSRRMPAVIVAAMRATNEEVAAGNRRVATTVAGVTSSWQATGNLSLSRGRWFDERRSMTRVAVIGDSVRRGLFGADESIGERILVAGEWRTVVGVLAPGRRSAL